MHEHLVAYEYGSGAVWGVVHAASAEEVAEHLPDVAVHTEPPAWMTDADLEALRRHSLIELADERGLDRLFEGHMAVNHEMAS